MIRRTNQALTLLLLLTAVSPSFATTVTINTESATAVLDALQNPQVTRDACLKIAAMPGNQGILRKTNEFKILATSEIFAEALYDAAHGIPVTDIEKRVYSFDMVKQKVPQLRALIHDIAANPDNFKRAIETRISLFTPRDADFHLEGYVVAGGDGGGYAFGGTDFYLNLGMVDELIVAKLVTTHELYHAVQGAYSKERGYTDIPPSLEKMPRAQQACIKTSHLFSSLYEEGSATYVGDISLLEHATSAGGLRQKVDLEDGTKHVTWSVSLLEMSVLSLEAPDAMSLDDVYDVGFFGHGILYSAAYVMAKAIVDQDGPQGLAAYLKLPPYRFIQGYTKLAAYGKDKDHPLLGPNTIATTERLAKGCPSGS
jgi:hypothetical protein